jgi:hypothetical protein
MDLPFLRTRGQSGPRYHVGSVLENRLGSQVIRVLSKNIAWRLRNRLIPKEGADYVRTLERDGVVVIKNFLPESDFNSVVLEYEDVIRTVPLRPYREIPNARLYQTQIALAEHAEKLSVTTRCFRDNRLLDEIASAVTRRVLDKKPEVFLDLYQQRDEHGIENDVENILHADLHTPTIKMFFYLSKVNEENGAFVYAIGSHKLTSPRLLHEYDISVRQAKLRSGKPIDDSGLEMRGADVRNTISPIHRQSMGIIEKQLCAEPNTLLIANNMGFHRRGEFVGTAERKALLINYRNSEKVFF